MNSRALILSLFLALTVSACGAADPAPTVTTSASLVGTWIYRCADTVTTIEITEGEITIVTHVDGQADSALVGAYSVRAGHLILSQDGAELDLGAYFIDGDSLAMVGSFAGVYLRQP
jgi:hypothetical protein